MALKGDPKLENYPYPWTNPRSAMQSSPTQQEIASQLAVGFRVGDKKHLMVGEGLEFKVPVFPSAE